MSLSSDCLAASLLSTVAAAWRASSLSRLALGVTRGASERIARSLLGSALEGFEKEGESVEEASAGDELRVRPIVAGRRIPRPGRGGRGGWPVRYEILAFVTTWDGCLSQPEFQETCDQFYCIP